MGIPIIAGYGSRDKCLASFVSTCPFCGKQTTLKIYETSNNINVYFVPIAKFNKHYYLMCHLCDKALEISKEKKKELVYKIKNQQIAIASAPVPQKPVAQQPQITPRKNQQPCVAAKNEATVKLKPISSGVEVLSGNMKGVIAEIADGQILNVGKDAKFANLVFNNTYKMVSRTHCTITFSAKFNKYFVTDNSSNGTYFMNGQRLTKNTRIPVARGSVLKLADNDCMIKLI